MAWEMAIEIVIFAILIAAEIKSILIWVDVGKKDH